jgi:hypothetical protein
MKRVAVTTTFTEELQALGTVRGRLGLATGPTLFYATGGLAYGYLKESASIIPGPAGILLGGAQQALSPLGGQDGPLAPASNTCSVRAGRLRANICITISAGPRSL